MHKTLKYFAACLAAACCAGCLMPRSPAPAIYQYTLEYEPPRIEAAQGLDCTLIVQPFTAAALYATRRIVYRDAAFKRDAYVYHQWRALPGDMAADMLRRDLQQACLFRAVLAWGSSAPVRYVLEGTIDEFFACETAGRWEAVLRMTVTLVDAAAADTSKKILFQKTYAARVPCEQKNPQSVVAAMSSAMAGLSSRICADVYAAAQSATASVR